MRIIWNFTNCKTSCLFVIGCIFLGKPLFAQQTKITDYVIFGGQKATTIPPQQIPLAPGYAVQLGSSCNIQGGSIGSYQLVKSTGNLTLGTNIYSGGLVQLANSNVVTGKIAASNATTLPSPVPFTSPVISIGSSATLGDSIEVEGSIVIGGGTLSGPVVYPGSPYTYSIPGVPVIAPRTIPTLPDMPVITSFPTLPAGSPFNFSNTRNIFPGNSYGNITLNGNKTLTFSGPGIYVIDKILNSGTSNNFAFDFKGLAGNIIIYVNGVVDLGKIKASITGGGSESRIFLETHGVGTAADPVAFRIANGSAGNASKWVGTVWAPYAAIHIGSGTGSTNITGALWSATQVTIQSGISMLFAPYNPCGELVVSAGPDKAMEVKTSTKLKGTTIAGASYHWVASNGGVISAGENTDEITVKAAGIYTLTVTSGNCSVSDAAIVTAKTKNLIGAELQSIYETNPTSSPFFIISSDGYVTIDIIVEQGEKDFVLNLLQQRTPTYPVDYGLRNFITNGLQGHIIITGEYPIINLLNLNNLDSVLNFCRPYYKPFNKAGLVTSAGDTTIRSNLVRNGYQIDGDGIKIGVISNSYATILSGTTATSLVPAPGPVPQTFNTNTMIQDIANGDLPGDTLGVTNPNGYHKNVHVLQDYPAPETDEGRAMLQIVHDVAPGAELYFRTGFFTPGDFALGIHQLREAGCDIIIDDITYITEPNLKDGVIARAVDEVKAQGVSYFSAAGNFENKSYEANFLPADASALVGFAGKKAHDFSGSGDLFQHVRLSPGNYTIVFQWVDDIFSLGSSVVGTKFDMDIYLTPNTDGTGLIGFNRDNRDGDPIEIMPFTISGTDSINYNFLIIKNTDTVANPARVKCIIYRGGIRIMEYNVGTSTIVGQANAAGAIAVGAARFNHVPGHPLLPAEYSGITKPRLEDFSSIGGTQIYDDAHPLGLVRQKPEIVGPDGGNTTVKMGQDYPNNALDGYSNFFGTSAAAPHAGAGAALIMQGRKKFLAGVTTTTPDQIKTLLQTTAVDMDVAGFDYKSGYGLVNIDSAMRTFAAPVATLIDLVVPPGTLPCSGSSTPFTITITGENFSTSTIVLLVNTPGDTTRIVPIYISSTEVRVTIPGCVGNPEVLAYTPPKVGTNGTDGGYSNSEYFFDAEIVVKAVNIAKKYGETLVQLDTIITINGKLLQDTTLTLADLGLGSMTLTTSATTSSNVGTYIITPARVFNPNNPADAELLVKFNYRFITGTVTINKMPLLVTPNNKTITYGEHVGNITFNYAFDETHVPNAQALKTEIKNAHEAFLPGNTLAVVKDFSKSQVGGSVLTTADLANMNTMVSAKALANSRKFKLENNKLVTLTDPETINVQYLVDIASESIFDYKADPSVAKFYNGYPGYSSKALLGETSLTDNTNEVIAPGGGIVSMINGSMAQTIVGADGTLVPMQNGYPIFFLNGKLSTFLSGEATPIPNSPDIQLSNNQLVYLLDGKYIPVAAGSYVQMPNNTGLMHTLANGDLNQILNGQEVPIVKGEEIVLINGKLSIFVSGVPVELTNGKLAIFLSGKLAIFLSGKLSTFLSGTYETLVNNSEYLFVNGKLSTFLSSSSVGATTPGNNTAVIVDENDINPVTGNWLGTMFGINMITGLKAGQQSLVPGVLVNPNFEVTYGLGTVTINKAQLTVTADNKTRQYGESNPALTFTYSGFVSGENLQSSGIAGAPVLNTTATISSPVGTYPITGNNGTLVSSNYSFNFVNGTLTVTNNPCLIIRPPFTNFGSTPNPQSATSLWANVAVKISGQLKTHGRYISFTGGTITLKDVIATDPVTNAQITTKDLPNGKVMADANVTTAAQIYTEYNSTSNIWTTHVPLGFSSTSDIFISGAIINSKDGFVKKKNNANSATIVQGIFYSDTVYSDQWTYALATYRPYFDYAAIAGTAGTGKVVAINGTYRAGTPLTPAGTPIATLVNGGSGGGGNNYTGSTSSFDNFTACCLTCPENQNLIVSTSSGKVKAEEEGRITAVTDEVRIIPNPASDFITLSFVAAGTGNSKVIIYSIDGRKALEANNGICESGVKYQKKIDVGKLKQGIYLVQLWTAEKIVTKKIIISE